MACNQAKVRRLLVTIRELSQWMNENEISEIGVVMLKVLKRLEKENGSNEFSNFKRKIN